MRKHDLIHALRESNPVDTVATEEWIASDHSRHLFQRIVASEAAAASKPPRGRIRQRAMRGKASPPAYRNSSRRLLGSVILATVILVGSSLAIAVEVLRTDPKDISTLLEKYDDVATLHSEGWRPELTSEFLWCLYEEGPGVQTAASEFPLDEPLTEEHLLEECSAGNDLVRDAQGVPTDFTLCEGRVPAKDIERVLDDGNGRIVEGDLGEDRHHFPIVLGWKANCEHAELKTWPVPELRDLVSLSEVNRARAVEIHLRATSIRDCLTSDEAIAMAIDARSQLLYEWPIVEFPAGRNCHEVGLNLWGLLEVR